MNIKTYKTKKVVRGDNLFEILDESLPKLKEKDIVVISSKIIAITQGNIIPDDGKTDKLNLLKKESDYYLHEKYTMHGIPLSIKNNIFGTGIDQSNGNGYFILSPKNLPEKTEEIWNYLREKNNLKYLGVIVSDGRIVPLRKGVIGVGLSWCGFEPLRNYVGKPDIFGHELKVTKSNLVDAIAGAATLLTGEGNEQTPLAVVSEISNITFVERPPTKEELKEMTIEPENDVFAGLLRSVKWIKGGS